MTTTSATTPALRAQPRADVLAERIFRLAAAAAAAALLAVLALMLVKLGQVSAPAWLQRGDELLAGSRWAPGRGSFGVLAFLYGTLVTSAIAMILAVPVAVGTALFLSEAASEAVRRMIVPLVDLLAAVPSVVYGLWGIFVLVPALRPFEQWLAGTLGKAIPLFEGPVPGVGYLTAGVVLAVMILPIISAVSREVFLAVPRDQREAALALGATRWETIRLAVLPASRAGVLGAAILGLGRALGETIAVTMVIGNAPRISTSVLAPGSTMASLIANEFSEATSPLHLEALVAVGLLLFVVALVVNVLARLLTRGVIRR
jgi:phosphate transport system permease protein